MLRVPLSSVLSVQPRNGWSPPLEFQNGSGIPVLTLSSVTGFEYDGTRVKLTSVSTQENGHYWLKDGDLLITRSNTPELVGHVAMYDGSPARAICCDLIMKMQVDPRKAYTRYLYYFLRSPEARDYFTSRAQGASSTMKKIGKQVVQDIPVPVPPLPEQQRIVAILDEAFEGIATAKANAAKNLQNAKEVFEHHLQAAFDSMDLVPLASLASDITDGDHLPPPKAASGVPFITISNIVKRTREIDFSDTFMVADDYFDNLKANKRPRPGDILYTVTGSFGIPVLVKDEKRFCFQRHIGIIRPKLNTDSLWLNYALLSPQAFRQASDGATGTAQKTVSLGVLREIKIPRLPVEEQRIVAAKTQEIEGEILNLQTIYQQKLIAIDKLKQSLLYHAFNGGL